MLLLVSVYHTILYCIVGNAHNCNVCHLLHLSLLIQSFILPLCCSVMFSFKGTPKLKKANFLAYMRLLVFKWISIACFETSNFCASSVIISLEEPLKR